MNISWTPGSTIYDQEIMVSQRNSALTHLISFFYLKKFKYD